MEVIGAEQAEDRQRRMAGALAAAGCRRGDRVAFWLPSSADLLCAVLGAARTGLVPVLLNATLLPVERDRLLEDADPTLTVLDPAALARLADGPPVDLARALTRPMHYTSGTTGRPKGVTTGLWDEPTAAAVFDDEAHLWEFSASDLHLVCSPMYHTVSIRFAAGTLLSGGSLAILDRFDADTALDALRQLRPTTTFMAPTHLHRLLTRPRLGHRAVRLLRLLVHAGSPCPPALKRAAMDRSAAVWEFYGSTEGQFTACSPDDWLAHPGTVGRARPGRRLTISDDGSADGAGDTIWCQAPPFARFEYWRNPQATAAAWRDDAFTVGDLGHLDDDGYLYLSGRRDDLIISGGVNVYPAEVEAALVEVPGVDEVAVVGVPDDAWGQRVVAVIVGDADLDAVRAAADQGLAPYKRPKEYRRADQLPHTATGKLIRREVL